MKISNWEAYNYRLKCASIVFGFLLMLGLSIDKTWAAYCVVFLIINFFLAETIWLKRLKGLKEVHHLVSNWILLASAAAYIMTNNVIIKILMVLVMLLSVYITLYSEMYYEKISFHFVRFMLEDFPILCLYNIMEFFKKDEPLKNRIWRYKIEYGICILAMVLACIFFPLYAIVDSRVKFILYFIIAKLISVMPIWGVCILLGVIPATVNYSIMRGLAYDIILDNPKRNKDKQSIDTGEKFTENEIVIKIVLWGLVIVNVTFIALQISYLFHLQEYQENIESLYHLSGMFPLLFAIMTSLIFVIISEYLIIECGCTQELSRVTYIYIFSLITLLLLVGGRYVLKVINFGIGNKDILVIISILFLAIILVSILRSIIVKENGTFYKLIIWGTVGFVLLSVLPLDYFSSQINVSVFRRRYQTGEFTDVVTEQDINLDFLEQMKYDAIPALVSLFDVPLIYEETNESLGESAKKIAVKLFYMDMTENEIKETGLLETDKEIERFQDILDEKIEYCVFGKKKIAYKAFCEGLEGDKHSIIK